MADRRLTKRFQTNANGNFFILYALNHFPALGYIFLKHSDTGGSTFT